MRNPAEPAIAVDAPEIERVLSLRSGAEFESRRLIQGRRYDRLVGGLRDVISDAIREKKPRLVCPLCGVAVRLSASQQKRFFFRHIEEDGSCPAVTRSNLDHDTIRALKYNGARESDAHKITKNRIVESLSADGGFSEVAVEKTWRAKVGNRLRRPDVQAVYNGIRIAFEAQLTTTFLDVVRGRRAFYLEDGALLVWILRRFDPEHRRMTEDDILFSNNSNILVVDEETWRLSREKGRFMLRCHYREPHLDDDARAERWQQAVIGFDELTLDSVGQRAFLFDFDARDAEVVQEAAKRQAERLDEALREEIFSYWTEKNIRMGLDKSSLLSWEATVGKAAQRGLTLPQVPDEHAAFVTAVAVLLSAKLGRPAGYRYTKLIQVAHQVAESHSELLVPFGFALKAYGTEAIVDAEDGKGTWRQRKVGFKERIAASPGAHFAALPYAGALRYLFPELSEKIRG
ncbi:DUF6035 family protein [Caenispirillum bisanense]|uniref:DUF6035 family protein n=1 Tax=Caenispirillum bisanense TaxID=414052 RepID=UPI0031DB7999